MMNPQNRQLVGLICSDTDLLSYLIDVIAKSRSFYLKAIWCSDTERSIQLAADKDVPSVSHTAFQLISRADTQTIIIAGPPHNSSLFCAHALKLKKNIICFGGVSLSLSHARLLSEFALKSGVSLRIIRSLRHSTPFILLRQHLKMIGSLQCLDTTSSFCAPESDHDRLLEDSSIVLHTQTYDIIDALSFLCNCEPRKIAVTLRDKTSVVCHFRLRELLFGFIQLAFGEVVANIRLRLAKHSSFILNARGDSGYLQLDGSLLIYEGNDGAKVLWQGGTTIGDILREGMYNFVNSDHVDHITDSLSESSLLQCIL